MAQYHRKPLRGRTIREFVLGVLIAPSVVTFLWFAVFGGAAIELDQSLGGTISSAASSDPAVGLFVFLQEYPLPIITSLVTIFLLWMALHQNYKRLQEEVVSSESNYHL